MYNYEFEKKFNEIFAKNLRHYMNLKNISQNELARFLNVSPTSVNNWYNGYKIPRMDKVDKICNFFRIKRSDIMNEHINEHTEDDNLPTNAILPSAHSLPVMGTICAGTGRICEDDYQGHFVIDVDCKADYCLKVKGDSMIGANIFDGDIVFITKSFDFETGEIYAVEMLDTSEASLKRVHKDGESLVLAPCNSDYTPTVTDYSEVRIAGKCVGVFHKYI